METQETDARAGLAAIAEGRRRMADRVVTPWWYHPALGIVIGLLLAAPSTQDPAVIIPVDIVCAIALGTLTQLYKRQTGVWPAARVHGATGRLRVKYVIAMLVVYFAAAALEFVYGVNGATIVAAVIVAVGTVLFGREYDALLRAELRGEA